MTILLVISKIMPLAMNLKRFGPIVGAQSAQFDTGGGFVGPDLKPN